MPWAFPACAARLASPSALSVYPDGPRGHLRLRPCATVDGFQQLSRSSPRSRRAANPPSWRSRRWGESPPLRGLGRPRRRRRPGARRLRAALPGLDDGRDSPAPRASASCASCLGLADRAHRRGCGRGAPRPGRPDRGRARALANPRIDLNDAPAPMLATIPTGSTSPLARGVRRDRVEEAGPVVRAPVDMRVNTLKTTPNRCSKPLSGMGADAGRRAADHPAHRCAGPPPPGRSGRDPSGLHPRLVRGAGRRQPDRRGHGRRHQGAKVLDFAPAAAARPSPWPPPWPTPAGSTPTTATPPPGRHHPRGRAGRGEQPHGARSPIKEPLKGLDSQARPRLRRCALHRLGHLASPPRHQVAADPEANWLKLRNKEQDERARPGRRPGEAPAAGSSMSPARCWPRRTRTASPPSSSARPDFRRRRSPKTAGAGPSHVSPGMLRLSPAAGHRRLLRRRHRQGCDGAVCRVTAPR
jgi:hypothetical protein